MSQHPALSQEEQVAQFKASPSRLLTVIQGVLKERVRVCKNGYVQTHTASISAGESKTFPAMLGCSQRAGRADAPITGAGFVSADPTSNSLVKDWSSVPAAIPRCLCHHLPAFRIRTVLIRNEQ
ncbi:uncharacterized protein WM294_008195 [Sarcoramphus papa]